MEPIFLECYRVLKKGGILLCGLDTGINYLFDEEERCLTYPLPFNPLQDPQLYEVSMKMTGESSFLTRWRNSSVVS